MYVYLHYMTFAKHMICMHFCYVKVRFISLSVVNVPVFVVHTVGVCLRLNLVANVVGNLFLYIILLEAPESNKTFNLLLIRCSFLVSIRIAVTVPRDGLDISC